MKKEKIVTLLMLILTLISCNGQNKNDNKSKIMNNSKEAPYNIENEGDGIKYNYDTLSGKLIESGKEALQSFNFKFPGNEEFARKIKEVYNWDINVYKNPVIVLRQSKFPEIVIKKENYILFQSPDSDNEFDLDKNNLFYYNQYVFYNDRNYFNLLKMKDPYILKDLVIAYGYNEDKELVKYVFNDFDFSNSDSFHDLIFSYNPEKYEYVIRKSMMDDIENIIYDGKTEDLSYAKEGNGYSSIPDIIQKIEEKKRNYENPDETIAYLYDKSLQVGISGYIEQRLDILPEYKDFLKKHSFYNLERLKQYVEDIYESSAEKDKENINAHIQDPDGYTNLRKEKNSTSEILQTIKKGEPIEVLDNSGDWFLIKTKEGKEGYVHKSRVKSN